MSKNKAKAAAANRPCPYCKRLMTSAKDRDKSVIESQGTWATVEHIMTQRHGGPSDPYNLIIACARCNNLRGHLDYDIFVAFARVVIQPYPETPTPVLRLALKDYVEQLAIAASKNKRHSQNALRVALLLHSNNLVRRTQGDVK